MKDILFILFAFSLIIGGLILQTNIASLNTTSWNFTGSDMAGAITQWLGGLFMAVGCLAIFLKAYKERE